MTVTLARTLHRAIPLFALGLAFSSLLAPGSHAQPGAAASPYPLIARWRFEEGAGTVTRDALDRFPGTLVGSVTFTPAGVAGTGLAFDPAQGGVVNFGNVLPLTNTAFTISAWFKTPPGDTTPEAVVYGKHDPWYQNGYYLLLNGGGGTIAGYGGVDGFFHGTPAVNEGQWHHVVQTFAENGDIRFYLDGTVLASAKGGPLIPSPANFMLGGIDPPPPARRFNGIIDEVQIYAAAVTESDVAFLRANPALSLGDLDVINFQPAAGVVPNPATVILSTRLSAGEIRYTVDGTEPTANSTRYSGPFSLAVTVPTTVRARVFLNGFPASEERSARYEPDPGIAFAPAESRFTNTVNVVVTTSLAGVGIRYTLDGSEPVSDSAVYSGPIALTNAVTVRARAFLNGFPVTEIVTKTYRRVYAFDDDGIAAAWRRRYFGEDYATDPRAGAEADPDGDGSSNRQEYLAESDPLDANSGIVVRIRAVPELRFGTIPGKKYRIHRRTSVNDPNPAIVAEITASGAETEYVDRDAGRDANPAFYLIQPVP